MEINRTDNRGAEFCVLKENWFLRNLDGRICPVITTTFCTICETHLMEIITFFNNAIIV